MGLAVVFNPRHKPGTPLPPEAWTWRAPRPSRVEQLAAVVDRQPQPCPAGHPVSSTPPEAARRRQGALTKRTTSHASTATQFHVKRKPDHLNRQPPTAGPVNCGIRVLRPAKHTWRDRGACDPVRSIHSWSRSSGQARLEAIQWGAPRAVTHHVRPPNQPRTASLVHRATAAPNRTNQQHFLDQNGSATSAYPKRTNLSYPVGQVRGRAAEAAMFGVLPVASTHHPVVPSALLVPKPSVKPEARVVKWINTGRRGTRSGRPEAVEKTVGRVCNPNWGSTPGSLTWQSPTACSRRPAGGRGVRDPTHQ